MSTWNETLKIGVPLIDLQHKQLLDQMDLLVESLKAKQDTSKLLSILKFLDMYVANHFGYEEKCMHINSCPAAGNNKAAHGYFVSRMQVIKGQIQAQKSVDLIANQVTHELLNWFVNHIRGIDKQLGPCVNKAG